MTLDAIKQRLIQHGAYDLLDLLPTCDRMRWSVTADLQPALVIGGSDTQDILASTKPTDDGRFEIRYCSRRRKEHDYALRSRLVANVKHEAIDQQAVEQDAVEGLRLDAPFKYDTDTGVSRTGQSTFTTIIQWYFMSALGTGVKCDHEDYCPGFLDALRNIESMTVEKASEEVENPIKSRLGTRFTPASSQPPEETEDGKHDSCTTVHHVMEENALGPPDSVPDLDTIESFDQQDIPQSPLPQRPPVGYQQDMQNNARAWSWPRDGHERTGFFIIEGSDRAVSPSAVPTQTLPVHTITPQNGSPTWNGSPRNSVSGTENDVTGTEHHCQNAAVSAKERSRGLYTTPRGVPTGGSHIPGPGSSYLSLSPSCAAVTGLDPTSSTVRSLIANPRSRHLLVGTPNSTISPTDKFTVINQDQGTGSSVAGSCNATSVRTMYSHAKAWDLQQTSAECELTRLLLDHLWPELGRKVDEPALLHALEHVWISREKDFELTTGPLFEYHREVFRVWISERRSEAVLQSMERYQFGSHTLESHILVARAMDIKVDLQRLRLKWKGLRARSGSQELSPQDLLCSTFAIMIGQEGAEDVFMDGLDR
jgi:hypothetical protein